MNLFYFIMPCLPWFIIRELWILLTMQVSHGRRIWYDISLFQEKRIAYYLCISSMVWVWLIGASNLLQMVSITSNQLTIISWKIQQSKRVFLERPGFLYLGEIDYKLGMFIAQSPFWVIFWELLTWFLWVSICITLEI